MLQGADEDELQMMSEAFDESLLISTESQTEYRNMLFTR